MQAGRQLEAQEVNVRVGFLPLFLSYNWCHTAAATASQAALSSALTSFH